jgi:class 3 adenylate cyclase
MAISLPLSAPGAADELTSFVPRLTLEWLRDEPDRTWQELEGTLAFVDVSGFTAMSERLSSLGKSGAEEVTDVMNATFASLLELAYGHGGGLLKFGGDALLLLFSGDAHSQRAARAAFDMRRLLEQIGRPQTSAGEVTLRMHVGIHSGRFHFFLVGETHRELLVCGPAATATVELESASEAGDVLLSHASAGALDPIWIGDEKGPGFLLVGQPAIEGVLEPLPDVTGIPVELAVPAPLRAQLLEVGPLEGEHRNAAIAFVRYAGIDGLIESEGPATAAEALDTLVRTIQRAAEEHAVTFLESDVDKDGGRIILVAGAPHTAGDDEERLLRTVRAVVDSSPSLSLHIGVSRGRVFAGQVGAPFRRTYTILGDTAALAARLMARAADGEILVAAAALERANARFEATELEPFQVKGKSEPVRASALGALAAAEQEQEQERELPFVDRERERAVLSASLAPVRMGYGSLVELIGEPGIGKSRLAQHLQEECADMGKVNARCDQYEASTPYFAIRPLLRSLLDVELNRSAEHNREVLAQRLGAVDAELVPWAPLLGAPLDVEVESTPEVDALDPSFWRARLHGVLGKVFEGVLDSATLMLFEDVHWMDDASSELLRYLGTQLTQRPWLACTTRRPVEGGFSAMDGTPPLPALTLRLEPLPEADAKTLIQAAAGDRALSEEELAAIADRAAGNPLFLQELATPDKAEEEAEEMPETVEALLATRIDALSPGDRTLLRWASVLGASFSGALIADVLEGDPNAAAGSEAWDRLAEFVERDPDVPGAFRFRHALIRDTAYEGLSYKRRRELHGRVGEVIEAQRGERTAEVAELLALHFFRGERWPEAWRYSIQAGRRAWRKYANVEAAQFFARAVLEISKKWGEAPADEVPQVWEELGDARMRLGEYEDAAKAYREARRSARDEPVEQARLMQKEAIAPVRLGNYRQGLARLKEALALLEGLHSEDARRQRARLTSWYGTVLQYQRRPADAVEWCQRAAAEAERSGAKDALAQAYFILDWAYVSLGRPAEAVHSERAIELFEELGDLERVASVLNNMGGFAYLEGRWDDAMELAERAREFFRKIGDDPAATLAARNIAEIRSDQGRFDEAEPVFLEIRELQRRTGNRLELAEVTSLLGRLAARTGSVEDARTYLEEAKALYLAEEDELEVLTNDVRIVELLVLQGEAERALDLSEDALMRAATMVGVSPLVAQLHRLSGWAELQKGDLVAARAALDQGLRVAQVEGENFGIRSVDYEVALTLDALVRLEAIEGGPSAEFADARDEVLGKLGIVKLPEPPLPR